MDLQDQLFSHHFAQDKLTTSTQFGQLVHDQLLEVVNLDDFAEEGSARSGDPKLDPPAVFGPQCTQHYGLSDSTAFFNGTVTYSGSRHNYHDLLWNWAQATQPQPIVHDFTKPGAAGDCP